MRQETLNRIHERALTRKDGVFVLDCIKYAVKDKRVLFLVEFDSVSEVFGGLLVYLGKVDRYKARKKLNELLSKAV